MREVTTTAEIAQVVVKDKQPTTSADSSEDRENGEASISQGRGEVALKLLRERNRCSIISI